MGWASLGNGNQLWKCCYVRTVLQFLRSFLCLWKNFFPLTTSFLQSLKITFRLLELTSFLLHILPSAFLSPGLLICRNSEMPEQKSTNKTMSEHGVWSRSYWWLSQTNSGSKLTWACIYLCSCTYWISCPLSFPWSIWSLPYSDTVLENSSCTKDLSKPKNLTHIFFSISSMIIFLPLSFIEAVYLLW